MSYYKNGAFLDDPWATHEVLTIPEWQARRADPPSPLALRLDPGFAVEQIADVLKDVTMIEVVFPKFTDGRGYSMGWLLRSRLGYVGEMRAVGDILFDEIQFMVRCGFDAFEIVDLNTLKMLNDGRRPATFDKFYQPGLEREVPAGTRPWARRLVAGNQA